jgi:hypothetical protein
MCTQRSIADTAPASQRGCALQWQRLCRALPRHATGRRPALAIALPCDRLRHRRRLPLSLSVMSRKVEPPSVDRHSLDFWVTANTNCERAVRRWGGGAVASGRLNQPGLRSGAPWEARRGTRYQYAAAGCLAGFRSSAHPILLADPFQTQRSRFELDLRQAAADRWRAADPAQFLGTSRWAVRPRTGLIAEYVTESQDDCFTPRKCCARGRCSRCAPAVPASSTSTSPSLCCLFIMVCVDADVMSVQPSLMRSAGSWLRCSSCSGAVRAVGASCLACIWPHAGLASRWASSGRSVLDALSGTGASRELGNGVLVTMHIPTLAGQRQRQYSARADSNGYISCGCPSWRPAFPASSQRSNIATSDCV